MKSYAHLSRQQRIEKAFEQRRNDLALVLENLSEELNISAILRSAEGFGVSEVNIIYQEGKKPKLSRHASSGAAKWLKINYFTSTAQCLNKLKLSGFKILATVVDPKAKILWETKILGKVAILVGNEAHGLSQEALDLADYKLYLPMLGLTESFNVSVAAALFLYEVIRQRLV